MNALKELAQQGQSIWLDYIRRNMLRNGELKRLVEEDGLRGVTSNPTIFEKAIAHSTDYDPALRALLAANPSAPAGELYEPLAIEDIQMAADVLRGVYEDTRGEDGYVSLEVSPHLAHDTRGTINEARRLRAAVARPNVMIKVPATPAGIPAIEELIAEGINVNVTLMFSLGHYEAVAGAYVHGLERCAEPGKVASVASFFVSRVDTMVDKTLEKLGGEDARALMGKIAIANSKVVYRRFQEIFHGEGFAALRQRGARVQRPLWASTGTKNPAYSDVLYVENLIGPETVNTLPPDTINAFRDHGKVPGATVKADVADAEHALAELARLGVDLRAITEQLQSDGVAAFSSSFDQLMAALDKKRAAMVSARLDGLEINLGTYQKRIEARLGAWRKERFAERLWQKDYTLWAKEPQPELTDRLGWLQLPETMTREAAALKACAEQARADGIRHVVLLGMGGSSLAPEVFQQTFGNAAGFPELQVLDSTHPAAVKAAQARIDPARALFLVSSKSGTTTETNSFFYYFWDKLKGAVENPGAHFIAITDPGAPLEKMARERNFRAIFNAQEDIGGRYSALTVFGLVPAALIGVDVDQLLARARRMSGACAPAADGDHPGLRLGAALGELALARRDKVTFLCSPSLGALPSWLEQLIAESTGKSNKGIVPVAGEPLAPPESYGADRFFVYLRLESDDNAALDRHVAALGANGHPVARIDLADKEDIGQEFFRWEFAVAAAGAAIGIHPFNQPDVQLAKDLAKKAMSAGGAGAAAPKGEVSLDDDGALRAAVQQWTNRKKARDYVSVQAYIEPSAAHRAALHTLAAALQRRLGAAITVGFGPRFLHSTGQLHKGGPNSVLVLQIVDQPAEHLPVPETDYSFDALIRAQALGDLSALRQRRRRVLRVNLGNAGAAGLKRLAEMFSA